MVTNSGNGGAVLRAVAVMMDASRAMLLVGHAVGSLERLFTDADPERKFSLLIQPALGASKLRPPIAAARAMGTPVIARELLQR